MGLHKMVGKQNSRCWKSWEKHSLLDIFSNKRPIEEKTKKKIVKPTLIKNEFRNLLHVVLMIFFALLDE